MPNDTLDDGKRHTSKTQTSHVNLANFTLSLDIKKKNLVFFLFSARYFVPLRIKICEI